MRSWRYSQAASEDLDVIIERGILLFGVAQANDYVERISRMAQTLTTFPFLGQAYGTRSGRELRRYPVGRDIIFYHVSDDEILVVRILDQAMDFDRHL